MREGVTGARAGQPEAVRRPDELRPGGLAERAAVCALPEQVKEKLREPGVHEGILIGAITLEAAGFVVDPAAGRLRRVAGSPSGP